MLTLGVDTTADFCSAGLWEGNGRRGSVRGRRHAAMRKGHAEALFPLVEALLSDAGAAPAELDRVAVVRGPGTFTGTRIGLAAARGLALALDIPAVGLTAFDLLAAADQSGADDRAPRAVAIDARRGELYFQVIAGGRPVTSPAVVTVEAAAGLLPAGPVIALGSGSGLLSAAAARAGREIVCRPEAGRDGALVAKIGAGLEAGDHPALPLYLRPPDAVPHMPERLTMAARRGG